MKQITECLDRFFTEKQPLRKKWRASLATSKDGKRWLCLTHYHHLVLMYDLDTHAVTHEWWELPADKRGLDAALNYLNQRFEVAV